jgi:putative flippase GtrA
MKLKIGRTRRNFLKFIIVGGFCACLNLISLYVLTTVLNFHYLISFIIVFILGNFIGFCLNKYFTFRTNSRHFLKELWKYYSVMLTTFGINLIFMYILVDILKIWYLFSSFIIIAACTIYNFFMHQNWSFK